ncbi:MAG: HPF/RaiA family ribosome-associated protein [Verrucomicrobia bacterium]|jgi:ribosome-associated translation inhibitor RaiA|nr:HPF/RaiA family ribosome-associated protein [Verrucomicrobiota bacterium]
MTITVQHLGLRSVHRTDATIENEILALRDLVVIDEARVRLERRPELAPAYSVRVHLVTPGPDIRAVGADHTIEAAIRKVAADLRRRIEAKVARRSARARSNRQQPSAPRRTGHRFAAPGRRA